MKKWILKIWHKIKPHSTCRETEKRLRAELGVLRVQLKAYRTAYDQRQTALAQAQQELKRRR